MSDLKYWLGFNLVKGIGPVRVAMLLARFGSIERAWKAPAAELRRGRLDERAIERLVEARERLDLDRELAQVAALGIDLLTLDDPSYPVALRNIENPPPLLYVKGALTAADNIALGVVGTRMPSVYGQNVTERMVTELVAVGFTVVSGLARGIDTVVHKAALAGGGRTVAVQGCGLDTVYPAENRRLAREIVEKGQGALISEYPLGTGPEPGNFPPRNRIISGLSQGVLVTEAGHKSGALITANYALNQGRPVFSVPGNITNPTSAGTNGLIRKGAALVTAVEEILSELEISPAGPGGWESQGGAAAAGNVPGEPLTPTESLVFNALTDDPQPIDEIADAIGLPIFEVSGALSTLDMRHLTQDVGGMNYVRAWPSGVGRKVSDRD
jgi:DNA processing protein